MAAEHRRPRQPVSPLRARNPDLRDDDCNTFDINAIPMLKSSHLPVLPTLARRGVRHGTRRWFMAVAAERMVS